MRVVPPALERIAFLSIAEREQSAGLGQRFAARLGQRFAARLGQRFAARLGQRLASESGHWHSDGPGVRVCLTPSQRPLPSLSPAVGRHGQHSYSLSI